MLKPVQNPSSKHHYPRNENILILIDVKRLDASIFMIR